jgi:hypothetical protein
MNELILAFNAAGVRHLLVGGQAMRLLVLPALVEPTRRMSKMTISDFRGFPPGEPFTSNLQISRTVVVAKVPAEFSRKIRGWNSARGAIRASP